MKGLKLEFAKKNVLIMGMGRSGIAASEKLKEIGADVTLVDRCKSTELEKQALGLRQKGIKSKLGPHSGSDLNQKDLVIVSPGIPSSNDLIVEAKKRGIPVWSEIELAYRLTRSPIIGITGTNGKTTTTLLVGAIFKEAGRRGVIAGNIGFPLVNAIEQQPNSTLVTEVSSFQLENIVDFRPYIGVLLNITEDHLDWHPDFADYVRAKSRLFMNQTEKDFAIINYDDPVVLELTGSIKANVIPFSKYCRLDRGVFVDKHSITAVFDRRQEICTLQSLRIRGEHNLDNAMAATAVGVLAGIPARDIRKALTDFRGIEHRIEFVAAIQGVQYFNDSKATNPDAAVKALGSFDSPIVLLAGGRNKGNSFLGFAIEIKRKAKAVVLFGEAATEMYPLVKGFDLNVVTAGTVPEAVKKAKALSQAGDVVLFSPACASFDQFSNYEERGHVFKEAVKNLKN